MEQHPLTDGLMQQGARFPGAVAAGFSAGVQAHLGSRDQLTDLSRHACQALLDRAMVAMAMGSFCCSPQGSPTLQQLATNDEL
jgi:hypothetical protein